MRLHIVDDRVREVLKLSERIKPSFYDGTWEIAYGAPLTDDPRHFLPDPECASVEEMAAWLEDYRRAERGEPKLERTPTIDGVIFYPDSSIHVESTAWGLGITRWKEEEQA